MEKKDAKTCEGFPFCWKNFLEIRLLQTRPHVL